MNKSKVWKTVGIVGAAIVLPLTVYAQVSEPVKLRVFAGLLNRDTATSRRTAAEAMQEQKGRIAELISIIERDDIDSTLGGPRHIAVTLIGRYRAKDAVPALSKRLMYLPDYKPGSSPMSETGITQMYYPCAAALVEIGQPSTVVTEMSKIIQSSANSDERDLACWVIMQIQGSGQSVVTFESLQKLAPAEGKGRLGTAKEFVENFRPTFNHPKATTTESRPPLPPGM